ncbi:type II toxin-antitoxin system RelE family toxin [Carnobacterium sp.]|uniref:type II toxin-antitoxin system RelE family toxin n=1 Tax=Carnobacterium sp. TaxID=48221 RepID=UPI00388F39DD
MFLTAIIRFIKDKSLSFKINERNLVNCTDHRKQGKGLTANRSGEWRYRIGDYRLIVDINDETVTILMLEIGHRKDIYK